jgi:hypothetical protein
VQIMELLIIKFSPVSFHFIILMPLFFKHRKQIKDSIFFTEILFPKIWSP